MSAIFGNLLGKQHLGTLFLIILFAMKLWNKKAFQGMETKFFLAAVDQLSDPYFSGCIGGCSCPGSGNAILEDAAFRGRL